MTSLSYIQATDARHGSSASPKHHSAPSPSRADPFLTKVMQHSAHYGPLHRRGSPEFTDTTLFSVPSTTGFPHASANNAGGKKKKRGLKLSLSGILARGRKKSLSESQLRKRLRKAAEKGDWPTARQLLQSHEFSPIPEGMPKRGSFNAEAVPEEPPSDKRRPSYGSRQSGERSLRNSFTRGESAAAAAVIKAALLEGEGMEGVGEGVVEDARPDVGENVLHDICRFRPPLDVVELLLAGLRHRSGCTHGTDDRGRTPLHVAASSGAAPAVIDALVRADPTPASMGDDDKRTPLHLAARCLVHPPLLPGKHHAKNKHLPIETAPTDEALAQTLQIVTILKDAMLSYPGRIDFKDEDITGYSPLDYAIESNCHESYPPLVQALLRRKEPRTRRGSTAHRPRGLSLRSTRSVYSAASSVTEDQDLDILRRLEREEVEARWKRIEKRNKKRRKERMNDALFDVFGIEEGHAQPPAGAGGGASTSKPSHSPEVQPPLSPGRSQASASVASPKASPKAPPLATDEERYALHLEEYLDGYMDDLGELEDLELHDEDGFDIFADPEENHEPEEPRQVVFPLGEISVHHDDDCDSVVSEVTVPFHP